MALLNIIGPTTGGVLELAASGGTFSAATAFSSKAPYCLRFNPTTTGVGWGQVRQCSNASGANAMIDAATCHYRFEFNPATLPAFNSEMIAQVQVTGAISPSDANTKLELRITDTGLLAIYDKDIALVETGINVVVAGDIIGITAGNGTSAAYEVTINGVTELSGTCNQQAVNCGPLVIGKGQNRSGQSVDFRYQNIAIDDASMPSVDLETRALTPTGDGLDTDWTGDYQDVDETPADNDTTYISTSSGSTGTPVVESVALQDYATAGISGTVLAVKTHHVVRDEGATTQFRYGMRSGASSATITDSSVNNDPGATYVNRSLLFTTDPATSSTWTLSGLDTVQPRVISRNTEAKRCTRLAATVCFVPGAADPPELLTASINAAGTELTIGFNEAVSQGAGYDDADLTLTASSGDPIAAAYSSGDGTNTWVFTLDREATKWETITLDWAGTADGIENGSGDDLEAIDDFAITNGSVFPLHTVRFNGDTEIIPGDELTVSALHGAAVGGQAPLGIRVENTNPGTSAPLAISGQSISGADASQFAIIARLPSEIIAIGDISGGEQHTNACVVIIAFNPTSTGTKNAVFNATIGGFTYAIPIQGVCGANNVDIEVVDGVTPSGWTREAPCSIVCRPNLSTMRLPAPWERCHFQWQITPPNGETFMLSDTRDKDSGLGPWNLFDHFPGGSCAIPVLEGQHGDWTIVLHVFVPGDELNPSITTTPVVVSVAALGTSKTTRYATAAGAGTHDGMSAGNAYSWDEAQAALSGTDNWHLIVTAAEVCTSSGTGWNLGLARNWSIVSSIAGTRFTVRPSADSTSNCAINFGDNTTNRPRGGWVQDVKFEPPQTGSANQTTAVNARTATSIGFYNCHLESDGISGGALVGDSFATGFSFNQSAASGAARPTAFADGIALFNCSGGATESYSLVGYPRTLVEAGCSFEASRGESVLRWLGTPNYWFDEHDIEARFYNAVGTGHDMTGDTGAKQPWRLTKTLYSSLMICNARGEIWVASNEGTAPRGGRHSWGLRVWGLCQTTPGDTEMGGTFNVLRNGHAVCVVCSYIENTTQGTGLAIRANGLTAMAHNTINIVDGGSTEMSLLSGNVSDDVTANEFKSNIVVSESVNTLRMFRKTGDGSAPQAFNTPDCVANNIFPASPRDLDYEVGGANHTSVAALNSNAAASGNTEEAITLDAGSGEANEDVSGRGRVEYAYFDYGFRPMTDASDNAGMYQDDPPAADPPTITSITPDSGVQGTSFTITITGTGFTSGTQITLPGGGASITNKVTNINGLEMTAVLTLSPSAPVGLRDVTVTNADTQSDTLVEGFEVTEASVPGNGTGGHMTLLGVEF